MDTTTVYHKKFERETEIFYVKSLILRLKESPWGGRFEVVIETETSFSVVYNRFLSDSTQGDGLFLFGTESRMS